VLLVQVRVVEDLLTAAEKRALVASLTDAVVSVKGEHVRRLTWVLVDELGSSDCGIGGQALTTNDVRALAAGAML
jgi:4-oxalocrotonate tautomerase